ncbi:RdRP-domain-containing protein [Panus rudis PR-1116 ss-1]|nr:RdRP-domain-containing protein [Panus rudis PR-1116 ss-1]
MDIFIEHIPQHKTDSDIKIELARALHAPSYSRHASAPLNLEVKIFPRLRRDGTRCGIMTVPTEGVGRQFLQEYGGATPQKNIFVGLRLRFKQSNKPVRLSTVEYTRRFPYVDPRAAEERRGNVAALASHTISLSTLQFGWTCRDNIFSVEWEKACGDDSALTYHDDRREFRITVPEQGVDYIAVIRATQIEWVGAARDDEGRTVVNMTLFTPPVYESCSHSESFGAFDLHEVLQVLAAFTDTPPAPMRQRNSAFHPSHTDVAAYTSLAVRFVCRRDDLPTFHKLCRAAHTKLENFLYDTENRQLFSTHVQRQFQAWMSNLPWRVAFQIESMVRNWMADFRELLDLRVRVYSLLEEKGEDYVVEFFRYFSVQIKESYSDDEPGTQTQPLCVLFDGYTGYSPKAPAPPRNTDTFQCLHVKVTPTSMSFEGPYPERSNRVIRSYPNHQDSFLRVSFLDEDNLQYRLDREVDGRSFIQRRVGGILKNGLRVGGRHFEFLAYSQSALKEHAVWFVKEFRDNERVVNASSIIEGLGDFRSRDPNLIRCPARYAARISQAFTATDSSLSIETDELLLIDDIERPDPENPSRSFCFTDGVGTISPDLARAIWRELRSKGRRNRRSGTYPRAYQVRLGGAKGMLSVDHRLSGDVICTRPSMVKFDAPDLHVEIARAFDKPGPFYLNRPLIMILEALEVPYETFHELQNNAVIAARQSIVSLARSAFLLESYGLGTSFRLQSIMLSLDKLGVGPLNEDAFWHQMMDFAINHVLRDLKHHARIPVPNAWNLVGVADIHAYLREGEIFAYIVPTNGEPPVYLEGPTFVSRSPTIHPGDVQILRAIGRPPPGSPFEIESLRNCIVFSIQGTRPAPSCLGGGDLDGDVYCVTMSPSLMPRRVCTPAAYTPAPRKLLNRESTMADVADFVTEYIYSDSLGLIATRWLVIADQSSQGVFDPDCLRLSELHSDAVDYPKNGVPVPISKIPAQKFRNRPDWNAPETTNDMSKFYESQRAIGRLFREIDLPALHVVKRAQRAQSQQLREEQTTTADEMITHFHSADSVPLDDIVSEAILGRISEFITVRRHDDDDISELFELYQSYATTLRKICADFALSNARSAMLTEEEVVVGTIVAKASQPRRRKDQMAKMREQSNMLVQSVGQQIEGDEGTLPEKSMERAWVAYRISLLEQSSFGAKSFGWIAMGEIFDAVKTIEESERLGL